MMYFVFNKKAKEYVNVFENTGIRVGQMKFRYALRLCGNGWMLSTLERVNIIRKLNGLKEINK